MESEIIETEVSEDKYAYSVTFIDGNSRVVLYCEDAQGANAIQDALATHVRDASIFS